MLGYAGMGLEEIGALESRRDVGFGKAGLMRKAMNAALMSLEPSGIRRINALARDTPGCIALALGEPEFDTPSSICSAVVTALEARDTHYPPNNGTESLREAIAAYMRHPSTGDARLRYDPDEVIVTAGATEALSVALAALLDPGDEVVIPTPAFSLYESIVRSHHGVPVPLDTTRRAFQIDAQALSACVTDRTKAIVLCSPSNPTGCVLDAASLDAVAEALARWGLYAVCDDVYNRLVYEEGFERFAARHSELRGQLIVVDSCSKPWAMTGWRLGWIAAARPIAREIAKMHQFTVSSVPSFEMPALEAALTVSPCEMRRVYRGRRDRTVAALNAMGLPVVRPQGAFYAFPSISRTGLTSIEFCERAIREAGVALVPGTCFGAEGHVRLSYCVSDSDLDEALHRLARFVSTICVEG